VSPDYFRALRIPILHGRPFTAEDSRPEICSVVVSDSLARRLWPGEDAVGKRLQRWKDREWFTVVGVARDVRNAGLIGGPTPEYYVSRRLAQENFVRTANFLLRGSAPPAAMESWLRAEVAALDPTIPVTPRTLDESVGRLAARPRFQAWLLSLFALTGLALAAAGLFGLVSYLVEQRNGEIGLRLALGATPAQIRAMVLGHAFRWTAAGAAAGLAGALLAGRAIRTLLYRVSPSDPRAFAAAALLLAGLALLAAWLPARRAARTDPMAVLRHD
jgi:predicted permease